MAKYPHEGLTKMKPQNVSKPSLLKLKMCGLEEFGLVDKDDLGSSNLKLNT